MKEGTQEFTLAVIQEGDRFRAWRDVSFQVVKARHAKSSDTGLMESIASSLVDLRTAVCDLVASLGGATREAPQQDLPPCVRTESLRVLGAANDLQHLIILGHERGLIGKLPPDPEFLKILHAATQRTESEGVGR